MSNIRYPGKAQEERNNMAHQDGPLRVITYKSWLLFLIVSLIFFSCLIWLIWGNLFIRVPGTGLLMGSSLGVESIQSSEQDGFVASIDVRIGQHVEENTQLLIMKGDLDAQLQAQQTYIKKLKQEQTKLLDRGKQVENELRSKQENQIGKTKASLEAARKKLEQMGILLLIKEKSMKTGIIDLPNVTETRIDYFRLLQEINSHEADLMVMQSNLIELHDKWQERKREIDLAVYKAEYEYQLVEARQKKMSVIRSTVSGTVAEISVKKGDFIKAGQSLMTIIPDDKGLYALVFVPLRDGKIIKPGMSAQIFPTIVNRYEFGSIKGVVQSVSTLATTPQMMMSLLKNEQMVKHFSQTEPQLAVTVSLLKNMNTPSGYLWTSSMGPPLQLNQGTMVEAMINVDIKRPIDVLLPVLTMQNNVNE